MLVLGAILLGLTVAYPPAGAELPAVSRTYVIGAVDSHATNVIVNGLSFAVVTNGAWAGCATVTGGLNRITVSDGIESLVRSVTVARAVAGTATKAVPRTYAKLDYAADRPRRLVSAPLPLVYVDPGHGGADDCGAVSPHGRWEKEANLLLAADIGAALAERGFAVRMTRETDMALKLYERPRAAHLEGAVAFVSVHHNAPAVDGDARKRYSGVYSWNSLGEALAAAICDRTGWRREHANFAVTRSPEIASCLVEADFITAPEGEAASFDPAVRRQRAVAIADGVFDWWRRQTEEERYERND